MEQRAVGGKEKKYVLYTVVNDDKTRAGLGVWMVRILLGSLLLVALAVVPYVSLRLAQVNDRTLVVFQPVPIHNHSRKFHHKIASHPVNHPPQSASLVQENHDATDIPKTTKTSNTTIVTLHESAVTLSLLEDTNNASQTIKNQTKSVGVAQADNEDSVTLDEVALNATSSPTDVKIEIEDAIKKDIALPKTQQLPLKHNETSNHSSTTENTHKNDSAEIQPTLPIVTDEKKESSTVPASEAPPQPETSKLTKMIKSLMSTSTMTTTTPSTTLRPTSKVPSSTKPEGIIHKLAYVATATSGNHVGGICIWKINKNVTKWSYFYDNIPIEFQSHQDSTDHEMRALIVAVRLWSSDWHDYHVVLRSQHQAIENSKHLTRVQLKNELEQLSDKHFTYEMEWRLRKDDSLMSIAYCLAKLHKNFEYWFSDFEQHVDELLGAQDWSKMRNQNHVEVPKTLFATDRKPERSEEVIGDLTSLDQF